MTCWSSKCFYNLFFNLLRTLFRFVLVYPFAHLRNMKGTLCAQIKGEYHWVCHVLGFGGKLAGNGFLPFSSKRWFCICLTDSDCIINMQMLNFNRILLTHIVSNLQIMFYIYICTDFFVLHVGCNKKKHFTFQVYETTKQITQSLGLCLSVWKEITSRAVARPASVIGQSSRTCIPVFRHQHTNHLCV